jgi:hypothetical protein
LSCTENYFIDTNSKSLNEDHNHWWSNIDLSPLEEYGLTKMKFEKCVRNTKMNFTPDEVQESIYHYIYSIENHPEKVEKYKKSPSGILAGLLGSLRKGSIWVDDSYRSPEEVAMELKLKQEREKLERLKAQTHISHQIN